MKVRSFVCGARKMLCAVSIWRMVFRKVGILHLTGHMNYRYKAHGVQSLALKRGMERERVFAPYAAFLALLVLPRDAVRNLLKYETKEMSGQYGYYEALDRTRGRIPLKTDSAVVASLYGASCGDEYSQYCQCAMRRHYAQAVYAACHDVCLSRLTQGAGTD